MIQKHAFYMHLISGDVQSGAEWLSDIGESAKMWDYDPSIDIDILAPVELVNGEWVAA